MIRKFPAGWHLQRKTRAASGDGTLEGPIIFKHERALFLDVFVTDNVAGVGGRKFNGFQAKITENFIAGRAGLDRIFFLQFHFPPVGGDGPSLEEG